MSRRRRVVKAAARSSAAVNDCYCGAGKATRGHVTCHPCKGCGQMLHSVYDEEAHGNHGKLSGTSERRGA